MKNKILPKINIFILVAFAFLCAPSENFAQEKAEARYQSGKMIEISDLLSAEETEDCTAKRYVGTVSGIVYTNKTKIESFTLKVGRNTVKIYLSPSLYSKRLKTGDAKNLSALIARNKKITVDTYICGASGRIILAMYILAGSHPDVLG